MWKRFVPMMVTIVLFYGLGAVPGARAQQQIDWRVVDGKIGSALGFARQYWADHFARRGLKFVAPETVYGGTSAYYVPREHRIYLNRSFLAKEMRRASVANGAPDDGDLAAIIVLWHEYGHAMQRISNLRFKNNQEMELNADYMAGLVFGAAQKAGLIETGDRDEATDSLRNAEDSSDMSPDHPNSHGPGWARVNNFSKGIEDEMNRQASARNRGR